MFVINDDNSIYATRGDVVFFAVTAEDMGIAYHFQPGDVLRIKIYEKKNAENVVLEKEFPVMEKTDEVEIYLDKEDTTIGEVISKPTDYWYEIEYNPHGEQQTIVGYNEDGPVVFKLYPEGVNIGIPYDPDPSDFPVVDEELNFTSPRPVANRAIAVALARMERLGAYVGTETGNIIGYIEVKDADGVKRKLACIE